VRRLSWGETRPLPAVYFRNLAEAASEVQRPFDVQAADKSRPLRTFNDVASTYWGQPHAGARRKAPQITRSIFARGHQSGKAPLLTVMYVRAEQG